MNDIIKFNKREREKKTKNELYKMHLYNLIFLKSI